MSPPNNPIYLWNPYIPPDSSGLPRAPLGSPGGPPGSSGLLWRSSGFSRRPSGRPKNVISGLLRAGPVRFGPVRFGPVRFGPVRSGLVRPGPVRFGPVRPGSVWGPGKYGATPPCRGRWRGGWVRGGRLSGRRSILVHPGFDRAEITARAGGRDSSAAALCGFYGISEFRLIFRNPLSLRGWTKTPFLRIK